MSTTDQLIDQLIDQLLANYQSPENLLGEQGILKQLTKLAEPALEAEMEQHLGYAKHDAKGKNTGNSRNGKSPKSVRSIHGDIEMEIPRDRNASFGPQLIKKSEKHPSISRSWSVFFDYPPEAEGLGVDAHWLRVGEKLVVAVNERPAQWNSKLAPEEREAIEAFLALPPDKRKLFGQLMKACGK